MNKRDFMFGAVIGVIVGGLFTLYLSLSGKSLPLQNFYGVIVPVLIVIGLSIAEFLAKFIPILPQVAKFAVVGGSNTIIDLLVFLIIANYFGVFKGLSLGKFNIVSFTIANINSYFWNRYWTFESEANGRKAPVQFTTFFLVSLVGFILNTGVIAGLTKYISAPLGFGEESWLAIAKIIATVVSLVANFVGYKYFVFAAKIESLAPRSSQFPK